MRKSQGGSPISILKIVYQLSVYPLPDKLSAEDRSLDDYYIKGNVIKVMCYIKTSVIL